MTDTAFKITSPYPGLRPFERGEAEIFFGREAQIDEMLSRLEDHPNFKFLAVLGASGSGKSSLVRAGLIPALDRGFLLGAPARWKFVIARPGDAPLRNLAEAWVETWHPQPETPEPASQEQHILDVEFALAQFRGGPLGIARAYRGEIAAKGHAVLVLIDQFEELFRFRNNRDSARAFVGDKATDDDAQQARETDQERQRNESASFVELLLTTAKQTDVPIYVLITMRSEFLGDCDAFLNLPESISRNQYLTPRLTRAQLSEAITRPLEFPEFQADIEPALVTRILNDVGTEPDQLPLMQHALLRTWQHAKNKARSTGLSQLRIADYEHVGGVSGALNQHANHIFETLGDAAAGDGLQWVAQRLFRSLSDRRDGGPLTRRPITVAQSALETGASESDIETVAAAFQAANLLVFSPPGQPLGTETRLDISHESLLRQWKLLQKWIEQETEDAAGYRRLSDAVKLGEPWIDGIRLESAVKWRNSVHPTLAWARRYDRAEDEAYWLPECLRLIDVSLAKQDALRQADEQLRLERERLQEQRVKTAEANEKIAKLKAENARRLGEANSLIGGSGTIAAFLIALTLGGFTSWYMNLLLGTIAFSAGALLGMSIRLIVAWVGRVSILQTLLHSMVPVLFLAALVSLWLFGRHWSLGTLVLMAIMACLQPEGKEFPLDELSETNQEGDAA